MTQPVPYLSPYVLQQSISASHKTEKMQVGMYSVMVGATEIKLGATSGPRGRIWPWLKHPGVAEMKKKFSRIQENWRVLNEGAESLLVAMAPWKEMTDRFDELQDWFDRFRERVRRDLSKEEDNSANMSDYIVSLKVHIY